MITAKDVDFSEVAERVNEISNIQKIETEIVVLKEQIAGNFIQVGQKLIEAKEEVEYGRWGEWLKEKVDFSHEQANRMMRIARECKDSSALTNLSQTKVFSLLALPEEEREEFIENNPVEDMTTRELEKAIKEKKQLEKEKEEAERAIQEQKKMIDMSEEDKERLKQENRELKNRKPETVEVTKEVVPEHIKDKLLDLEEDKKKLEELKQAGMSVKEYERQMNEKRKEYEGLMNTMRELQQAYDKENEDITRQATILNRVKTSIEPLKKVRGYIEQDLNDVSSLSEQTRREIESEINVAYKTLDFIEKEINRLNSEVITYG